MKKLALLAIVGLFFVACKQGEPRYTQSSAEIDSFKAVIDAYVAADWETYTSKFADSAKVYHNSDDKFMTPAETVESHKTNTAAFSSYGFDEEKGDMEMVVTDKGETWVNFWGVWNATVASNGQKLMIPVHVTAQFVDGKVVKEYGYWDNAPIMNALEAAAAAAAANEDESDEAESSE